nr:unnamed protein product [Spirometra erinaceieuropaei]
MSSMQRVKKDYQQRGIVQPTIRAVASKQDLRLENGIRRPCSILQSDERVFSNGSLLELNKYDHRLTAVVLSALIRLLIL